MTKDNQNPALKAAKKNRTKVGQEIELSTGVKVILSPVSTTAIFEAQAEIVDPVIPLQKIEGKPGEFENPNDPDYLKDVREVKLERYQAGFDTLTILGVKLVDGLPVDDEWLVNLKYLERRGRISLKGYDLDDGMDREFLYKKHIAMSGDDWNLLAELSGITTADIEAAEGTF